jgi:CRISPR-associated endonuclease/helicase Cas3
MTEFSAFFEKATGKPPFPYQEKLARGFPSLLNAATGAGKTAAVVIAWLWRRQGASPEIQAQTPRRLIYCLPIRGLVEQSHDEIQQWLDNTQLNQQVTVHKLMGGAVSQSWDVDLDKDLILVGTQDQLLSRALNRGYAMSRYRWPVHFAYLNNDCQWVIDETQLMGAGLRTTAQLQWLREKFATYGVTQTLWMSATLDTQLLKTVDYPSDSNALNQSLELGEADKNNAVLAQRLNAKKSLRLTETVIPKKQAAKETRSYARQLVAEIVTAHQSGTLTLVVCNRVNRAQAIYRELQQLREKGKLEAEIGLIHSRFRAGDRQLLSQQFLRQPFSGILVATQIVEAGVDISATTLLTELCPWSSYVQRLGRCNRYGSDENAVAYWINIESADTAAIPYSLEALEEARSLIEQLQEQFGDVGIQSLQTFIENLPESQRPRQPVEGMVLRQHDLLQLFDTASDLAGHDIDISPFVRETEDSDVEIFWRDWGKDKKDKPSTDPSDRSYCGKPQRDELCRVSIGQARDFVKTRDTMRGAWTFDTLKKQWRKVRASDLFPGMILLVHKEDGGYSSQLGFTGDKDKDFRPLDLPDSSPFNGDEDDPLSEVGQYITLTQHAQDTFKEACELCENLNLAELPSALIQRAARYHDAGKAHPEFQKMLTWNREDKKGETLWAKSDRDPKNSADRPPRNYKHRGFRYLRHEWASALLALQNGEDFLLAYLVACHHGKVRLVVQPYPNEIPPSDGRAYARGVWQDDLLPYINLGEGVSIQPCILSLDCVALGDSDQGEESWVARSLDLLEQYGPFRLAYLETLVRVADWRASKQYNPSAQEQ